MEKIVTTKGEIDFDRLVEKRVVHDNYTVYEYYLDDELVHRSTVVGLSGVSASGTARDLTR